MALAILLLLLAPHSVARAQGAGGRVGRGLPVPVEPISPDEIRIGGTTHSRAEYERSSLLVVRTAPGNTEITVTTAMGELLGRASGRGDDVQNAAFRVFELANGLNVVIRVARLGYEPVVRSASIPARQLVYEDFILCKELTQQRVVFTRTVGDSVDICSAWPDGGHLEELVATPAAETEPCLAPDGGTLYFVTDQTGRRSIRALDLATGETRDAISSAGSNHSPACSPDGRRLAFISDREGDDDVFVMDLPSGKPYQVSRRRAVDRSPSFSPDGTQILFSTDRWGSFDLAIVSLGTGQIERLTDDPRDEIGPAWSPDGAWLAYTLMAAGRPVLKLRRASSPFGVGPDETQVPPEIARGLGRPSWSPDSRWVLASRQGDEGAKVCAVPLLAGWEVPVVDGADGSWRQVAPPDGTTARVVLHTDRGDMVLELNPLSAPETTANFLRLVGMGFYNGLLVYRVLPGISVQAGCPYDNGTGGPGWTLPLERTGLSHRRGTLSMVHGFDQGGAGSQFVICLDDVPALDGDFAAFGRVADGMEVADRLDVGDSIIQAYGVRGN